MKLKAIFVVLILASCSAAKGDVDDSERIIGGSPTTIERFPYQVSLRRNEVGHICGGSIISQSRILTAAQCLEERHQPNLYTILAGATNRTDDSSGQVRQVASYVRHPNYNPRTNNSDIAIVRLQMELVFTAAVRAIPIRENSIPPFGANATVTGWGLTIENDSSSLSEALMVTTKPIVTNRVCNRAYGGDITLAMLCAGAPEGGRDTCTGDRGGPLVVNGNQEGISSWSRGCGRPGIPGIYTRTTYFERWIREVS